MATGKAALSKMSASARARALAAMASDADSGADEVPQKTIQPVSSGLLAAPVSQGQMGIDELLKRNVASGQILAPLTQQLGIPEWEYSSGGVDESGNPINFGVADPGLAQKLAGYTFDWKDTGPANTGTLTAFDPTGKTVGAFDQQDQSTGSALAEWAALAAAGFGGAGLLGLGPLGGALGSLGGAGTAAGAGAADVGALGLAEGVYGAGGALGAGAAPGTIGGLAGSTAGFGGLGSMLPAGVGYGAAGAGALAGAAELGSELAPSLDFSAIGQPQFTPSLSGGIEPFVQQLPTIGAETTAFGGLPELSTLAAGAPVETAFGSFGAGLLTPEVAATVAATQPTFNPEALQTQNPFGGGLGPVAESVPSIAAETTAFGNLPELSALAAGAPVATPLGSFGLPAAQPATSVLGTVKDTIGSAAQWMKDNPVLGRLIMSGATGLLSGAGGGSPSTPQTPSGPPVQWNSNLQQGLLSPVQQYAPPAVQQNRPAGLLAQGYANDGAWRYLKG
jgi:hypothetical protein